MVVYVIVALVLVLVVGAALFVRILKQYERAVMFRLGRVKGGARGPGLIVFVPFADRVHRVSLRIVTMPIQSQGIITRDNVSVDVSAVAYYRIADAIRSVVAIENVSAAINQIAQTTLRAVVGRHTLDETLSETDTINQNIREILDVPTEDWGIQVTVVELKDIQLPETMKRAMARQAEAEREKRAKIIAAEGEALAAGELARASDVMMAHPLALQLSQPSDPGRDLRRQELDGRLPGAADEHDPGAGRLLEPRDRGRGASPRDCAHGRAGHPGGGRAGQRRGWHHPIAPPRGRASARRYPEAGNRGDEILSLALVTVLAVGTGVVVIVVAIAVVLLVLIVAASMRGREKRRAQRSDATRRDLGEAHERAERAERDRDIAQEQAERRTDPDR
jgi:hypothetical protein